MTMKMNRCTLLYFCEIYIIKVNLVMNCLWEGEGPFWFVSVLTWTPFSQFI